MIHDWDRASFFCRRCGAGMDGVEDDKRPRDCIDAGNVTAISHIIARRKFQAFGLPEPIEIT